MAVSFLSYFLSRISATIPEAEDTLIIQQEAAIHKIAFSDLSEALAIESGYGTPVTLAEELTLTAAYGTIYLNPPDGTTMLVHLPVYASVSGRKCYRIKNIGLGLVIIDAVDGKLIDNQISLNLLPGDRCEPGKDGVNWQTF